jgi:hypothetical protein
VTQHPSKLGSAPPPHWKTDTVRDTWTYPAAAAPATTDCCGYPDRSSAKSWRWRLRLHGCRRRQRYRHRCIYLLLLSSMYLSHWIVCWMILRRSLRGAEIQTRDDGRRWSRKMLVLFSGGSSAGCRDMN